jgi:hypothetical protein
VNVLLNNDLPLRCSNGEHPLSGKYNHYVWDDGTCMVAGRVGDEMPAEDLAELKASMDHEFAKVKWTDEHPGETYPYLGPNAMSELMDHIMADKVSGRSRPERDQG